MWKKRGREERKGKKKKQKWSRKKDPIHPSVLTLALDLRLPSLIRPLTVDCTIHAFFCGLDMVGKTRTLSSLTCIWNMVIVSSSIWTRTARILPDLLARLGEEPLRPVVSCVVASMADYPLEPLVVCLATIQLCEQREINQELFIVHIDIGRETISFPIDFFREETLKGIKVNLAHRRTNWRGKKRRKSTSYRGYKKGWKKDSFFSIGFWNGKLPIQSRDSGLEKKEESCLSGWHNDSVWGTRSVGGNRRMCRTSERRRKTEPC